MDNFQARVQSPSGYHVDSRILEEFERGLNVVRPEASEIPCKVLGYGEISTVLNLLVPGLEGLAFKRVSIFRETEELESYLEIYQEYNHILEAEAGLQLPIHGYCCVETLRGRPVLYLIQERLPAAGIANNLVYERSDPECLQLYEGILDELEKVWEYNEAHPEKQVAIDGQLSNWCLRGRNSTASGPAADPCIQYIDTSTPQIRIDGQEKLDGELFLRSAPPVLDWLLRAMYMEEVMERYYDPINVVTDLIANFFKEGRADLIPELIVLTNQWFARRYGYEQTDPFDLQEIRTYYQRDKSIWSLYLFARRLDRFIRLNMLGAEYPYILPGPVDR